VQQKLGKPRELDERQDAEGAVAAAVVERAIRECKGDTRQMDRVFRDPHIKMLTFHVSRCLRIARIGLSFLLLLLLEAASVALLKEEKEKENDY
jgi:hypothetical protein